jgi:predicted phosphodiesterase
VRVVIMSDVHGNIVALEAVLADIRQHAAPDALIVAGDMALVGPRPAEAVARLRSLDGAAFLMGNCDRYIVDREPDPQVSFALERLSADDIAFLEGLPFGQRIEAAPGHRLLAVHANPRNLEDPIKPRLHESLVRPLLDGVDAEVVAFGHYHVPFTRRVEPWTLVDVASVGLPRDGDQRAVYAIVTWDGAWRVEHRRVPFDIQAVARDYREVGFPGAEHAAASLLRSSY